MRENLNRCKYCGRFFKPDIRLGVRQKSCGRELCNRKRKKESQRSWCNRNPDYFKGRYSNTREWRKNQSVLKKCQKSIRKGKCEMIQDSIAASKPLQVLRLLLPEKVIKEMVQDSIMSVSVVGKDLWVTGIRAGDTRFDRG